MVGTKLAELNPKAKSFLEKFILNPSVKTTDPHAQSREFSKQHKDLEKKISHLTIETDKARIMDQLHYSIRILQPTAKSPNYETALRHLSYVGELIDASIKKATTNPPKPHTKTDRSNYLKDNATVRVVEREKERVIYVAKTLSGMKAAATKIDADIDALRKKRAAATSLGDMKALEDDYRAKISAQEQLGQRIAQFEHFEKTSDQRVNLLLDAKKLENDGAQALAGLAKSFAEKPKDKIDTLEEDSSSVYFTFEKSVSKAKALNEALGKKVAANAERILRSDNVYPGEPELTALSAEQAKLLNDRLTLALQMLDTSHKKRGRTDKKALEQSLKYAQVLHDQVASDMSFFVQSRSTGLPQPPEPDVDRFKALLARMDRVDAQILDLFGRGEKQAGALRKRSDGMRGKIDKADQTPKRDFSACETEIEKLEADIKKILDELPPPGKSKGRTNALKAASALGKKLATELFNAKPLGSKDADRVDVPGKDWGFGGKPDNCIPFDQVIVIYDEKGNPSYHRIDMRKEKGTYVTRRDDKEIPRSTLDLLKSRVDTLNTMSQTMAEGCDDVLTGYATETAKMMAACTSKEGREQFAAVEKQLVELEKNGLNKKVVQTYRADDLLQLEADWKDFRKRQPEMMPKDAHAEIFDKGGLKERIDALVTKAEEIEKAYKRNLAHVTILFDQMNSMGDGITGGALLGLELQSVIKNKAKRLIKLNEKSENPNKTLKADIENALKTIKEANLKPIEYQGPLRSKFEEAQRYNEMKTEHGVAHATKVGDAAFKEMNKLKDRLIQWNHANDASLLADADKVLALLQTVATGATGEAKRRKEYEEQSKKYDELVKQINNAASGKVNRKEINNRLKMVKAQKSSIAKDLKKFDQYENATAQMKKLLPELETIKAMAEKDSKGRLVGPGNMKVGKRFDVFAAAVGALSEIAAEVVDKRARPKASQEQLKDKNVTKGLDDTDNALKSVKKVVDLTALGKACHKIEEKRRRSKAQKIAEREEALALLHKARARLDNHPALQLYRDNPFDGGQQFVMVRNTLHNLEVGILASVNPRQHG